MTKKVASSHSPDAMVSTHSPAVGAVADTRLRILNAAIDEFCLHGRSGASTARIVATAGCNIRMIYHYFGNKDGLYRAALLQVYAELRNAEKRESFWSSSPREGVARLTQFTFDYMDANPRFPKMILAENLAGGETVAALEEPFAGSRDLMSNLESLIAEGYASGDFGRQPRAFDLYLTILALSFIHISNRHTLGVTFGVDLGAPDFLAARRAQVIDAVLAYLGATQNAHFPPDASTHQSA